MSEVIDEKNERIKRLFQSLERAAKGIQRLASGYKPLLGGEYYYTDSEVAASQTLQEWRNNGQIAYSILGQKQYTFITMNRILNARIKSLTFTKTLK